MLLTLHYELITIYIKYLFISNFIFHIYDDLFISFHLIHAIIVFISPRHFTLLPVTLKCKR
jgi:hypothetical protein